MRNIILHNDLWWLDSLTPLRRSEVAPEWHLPQLPEIHKLGFKERGCSSHEISCHIQEVSSRAFFITMMMTMMIMIENIITIK
jgi:hypothetical protein